MLYCNMARLGWHLRDRKRAAWLALLALALQFLVSFGHVHAGHEHVAAATTTSTVCAANPADHCVLPGDSDHDEDSCAICWVMTLVAASALPIIIGLLIAKSLPVDVRPPVSAPRLDYDVARAFFARGPPGHVLM